MYKNYILMDNFRGFSKTVVPIAKTNFLVGENSTGKSSLLSLVKILSSNQFWHKCELKCDEVNLGYSRDIISAVSKDKSYFRVGYINDGKTKKKRFDIEADYLSSNSFLIKYVNVNGNYSPSIITLLDNKNVLLSIEILKRSINVYVRNKPEMELEGLHDADKLLSELIEIQDDTTNYKKIDFKFKVRPDIRSLIVLVFHHLEINKQIDSDRYLDYIIPYKNIKWVAPIRSKPRRTYDEPNEDFSPEGEHTPYLLRALSSRNKGAVKLIEKIGDLSGLFKRIVFIKYGVSKNSPFEFDVVLEEEPINIINVGYGVSQSIPVIVEMLSSDENSWLIVQQPEVHLHPKAQAGIGEVVFDTSYKQNKTLLIETHSDYMIDRFRIRKRKEKLDQESNNFKSQILFFSRSNGQNYVKPIEIKFNGEISEDQPAEYREFFISEQLEVVGL